MLSLYQRFVQFLLVYKLSYFYTAHIALMAIVFLAFIYCFYQEKQIVQSQENPPQSKCHSKVDYVDYKRVVKQTTDKEVQKLQNSEQFRKFLRGKNDPSSRYYEGYRDRGEVEEIVFSDEQQDQLQRKIN